MLVRPLFRTRRRGTYLVEFAFVGSMFFLFLFGIIEYARFVMTLEVLQSAAREGARYAVVHTYDKKTIDIQNLVDARLANLGTTFTNYNKTTSIQVYVADPVKGTPVDINGNPVNQWTKAPFTNAKFGQPIAVQITGTYQPMLPTLLLMKTSLALKARYLMYSEAN